MIMVQKSKKNMAGKNSILTKSFYNYVPLTNKLKLKYAYVLVRVFTLFHTLSYYVI